MNGFDPIEKKSSRMTIVMVVMLIVLTFFKNQLNPVVKVAICIVGPITVFLFFYFLWKEKKNAK